VARTTDGLPPLADAIDGKACPWQRTGGGCVMVDPDTHPTRIGGKVVDPVGTARPSSLIRKSWTRTSSGLPWGRYSRPLLRKSPTSSFFLVSTEITGCCSATAVATCVLM